MIGVYPSHQKRASHEYWQVTTPIGQEKTTMSTERIQILEE
jgi:hypothetical protein